MEGFGCPEGQLTPPYVPGIQPIRTSPYHSGEWVRKPLAHESTMPPLAQTVDMEERYRRAPWIIPAMGLTNTGYHSAVKSALHNQGGWGMNPAARYPAPVTGICKHGAPSSNNSGVGDGAGKLLYKKQAEAER